MSQLHDYTYRILIIGDSNVGKTHIISNYVSYKNIENQVFTPTIGVDFHAKLITSHSKNIKLQIWDTSGDKNFKNIVRAYYTSVAAAVIVYDITRRETFENIKIWLEDFRKKTKNLCNIPVLVIGSFPTHKRKRQVQKYELELFGELHNTMIAEVECYESMYLHNIFQPLWDTVTNKFVITEKYNPGIKCLTRELLLSKISKNCDSQHILEKSTSNYKSKQNNITCAIS